MVPALLSCLFVNIVENVEVSGVTDVTCSFARVEVENRVDGADRLGSRLYLQIQLSQHRARLFGW